MENVAVHIMSRFLNRTGITSDSVQQRYLWTDAFAVCNLLGLQASGADPRGQQKALTLVDAVHHTLGQHRSDDERAGWISGLAQDEGESHPTAGGLRIGKPLPEQPPRAHQDPRREWDQDGQYFHYLTRWMHALDQTAWATGDLTCNHWARELAAAAFRAFSYVPAPGAPRRMYWKMSIDLSRPLVPAMGHHDPLDGYLTCLQLRSSAVALDAGNQGEVTAPAGESLVNENRALAEMVAGGDWATDDPLGLGSLMTDVCRLFQIEARGQSAPPELLPALLTDVRLGLDHLVRQNVWQAPAGRRLAFRELGLAIGIRALERLHAELPMGDSRDLAELLAPLAGHTSLADRLIEFWTDADNQWTSTWADHQDINEVMLATALAPDGYIQLGQGEN